MDATVATLLSSCCLAERPYILSKREVERRLGSGKLLSLRSQRSGTLPDSETKRLALK